MTIKVYNSIMPGEPDEVYQDHGITVEQWVKSKTTNYRRGDCQPISCSINGAIVRPMDWADALIHKNDNVEFRVVPRGGVGDILAIAFPTIFGPIVGPQIAIEALIDIPGQPGQGQGRQGQQLNPADARANTARPGAGIPEGFGEYIRYPDYANQPRRYYQDTKTQVLNLLLCVGVGEYDIDDSTIKIGETPIDDISGASYQIIQPGADVSSIPHHENWFNSSEVGSTTASAGIRLKGVTYDERTYFGSVSAVNDVFSGVIVGEIWEDGLRGDIKFTQDIFVVNGTGGTADIFQGAFEHLAAGMTVDVESTSIGDGQYVITTINGAKDEITLETTGGTPITSAVIGSHTMSIDKAGTQYVLAEIQTLGSIRVERVLDGGATDPDWNNLLPQTTGDIEIVWIGDTFTANRSGPFLACPESETTDEFEVDIFAPQGLGTIDGESIITRSRTIRIEWREAGTLDAWTEQTEVVSGKTRDQLGWTFTVNLPSAITPEVRVSRIGNENVSVAALDRLEFSALRSKLPTVTSYSDVTMMAVTVTGADEISNQSNNQINLEATRKLPEISGGAFTAPVATRKISAAACYVAKSLGYGDDQLDLDEFERLETIWTSRGDTFNYVFADGTAKDAIDTILRAGFAEMTIDRGVISPVRDEPRTTLEQGYSPENMTAPLRRQFTGKQPDEPDGVEVEYTKAGTWTTETVKCLLPGDQQIKLDKIKLNGVTDETRAWRIGMRRRRAQRYRRWTYTFDTELDALNSSYLSYVPLVDDIPGYGKVCILEAISADRIIVSEPVTFEAGKTHVVAYRDENGDTVGPFTATQGPDEFTILVAIPEPWPAILPGDREPTHVYFGTTERWHFPALITQISPSSPLEVSVTASNYDERVYADDDGSPP